MSDLIERHAAIYICNKRCEICGEDKKYNGVMCRACNLDRVADEIEDLTSVQPIIHCQDCSKRRTLQCPFGIMVFDAPSDDDFCSRAERREE